MHVLHVIESLEFGGAEKVTVHLANRLAEHHNVTLCLVKYRGELVSELSRNINLICLDLGEGIHFSLPGKLAQIIEANSVEVVNIHNWAIFFECFLAARKAGNARVILTVHGPYTSYGIGLKGMIKRQVRHFLERRAAGSKHVYKIVTVSDAIQDYITHDIGIPKNKLVTIHNGIARNDCVSAKNTDVVRLITVGRLAPIKNHKLMIDALRLSLHTNKELILTIVGEGPERARLETYVEELEINNHVVFLGFRADIIDLLSKHDIFLISSDYEGISIALLESMSLSRPAIATNVGGISETIQNEITGLIVPKGDRKMFAEAILRLAKSPELRQKLGLNAKKHFESNFHEDIVIEKYINLYKSCVSSMHE